MPVFGVNHEQESWARQEAAGMYNSAQYAEIKDKVECVNGTAIAGTDVFKCSNVSNSRTVGLVQQPLMPPPDRPSPFLVPC